MRPILTMVVAAIWFMALGCSPEYPRCGERGEDGGSGGSTEHGPEAPREPETDPPVVTEPWPSGGELAEGEGYRRSSNGDVCICSTEEPGCSVTEPGEPIVGVAGDNVCTVGVEADPDCPTQYSYTDDADAQTPSICGEVYWCCYRINCSGVLNFKLNDVMICPAQYKAQETRKSAFDIWNTLYVIPAAKKLDDESASAPCWVAESNCRAKAGAVECRNYPLEN